MSSKAVDEKPHAVFVPYPSQGHVHPMLKVAKLLHSRGFHITFVNTEFNHQRLLRSNGPDSAKGLEDFRFETIPDGLPPSDYGATQDIPSLCDSTSKNCRAPFRDLLARLNSTPGIPPVNCVVSDGVMTFSLDVADEFQIPGVAFWTTSACGMMGYLQYRSLIERGIIPFQDDRYLVDGSLERRMDWIPGMGQIRLRDMPSFIRTTDGADIMLNFMGNNAQRCRRATAVMLNTFDDLEKEVLDALAPILPPIYTIGFLPLLQRHQVKDSRLKSMGSSLWKEEMEWLDWLEGKEPASVFYVNFGSITTMTPQHLIEFAWGLADSGHPFLWVVRQDLVKGESAVVPREVIEATAGRGLLLNWVPQEELLQHPAVGGFLTHCGWNSTVESFCGGVPMVCWPFFAEQQTNCRFACREWGVGVEIDEEVRREEVEVLVREVMEGEKGKVMREKAMEWRVGAERAAQPGGSSYENLNRLIREVLLPPSAHATNPRQKEARQCPGPEAPGESVN